MLIVGAGYSVNKYKKGILNYIEKNKPIVLFLNINRYLSASLAHATIVSSEMRVLFDSQVYHNLKHPIILPESRLGKLIKDHLKGLKILIMALRLKKTRLSFLQIIAGFIGHLRLLMLLR